MINQLSVPNFVKLTKMSITSVCDVADEMGSAPKWSYTRYTFASRLHPAKNARGIACSRVLAELFFSLFCFAAPGADSDDDGNPLRYALAFAGSFKVRTRVAPVALYLMIVVTNRAQPHAAKILNGSGVLLVTCIFSGLFSGAAFCRNLSWSWISEKQSLPTDKLIFFSRNVQNIW